MKKTYEKPLFAVERFTMAQSVAAGCDAASQGGTLGRGNQWSRTTCAWVVGGYSLWAENPPCQILTKTDGDAGNGIAVCYNAPAGGGTVFHS